MAPFARPAGRAPAPPLSLSGRGARGAVPPALGGGGALARRRDAGRAGRDHGEPRRIREQRARPHRFLALSHEPYAALAPAPPRPAARRVLYREAARGAAASAKLPPGGARNRRPHDARHQEPASIAERAVLRRGRGPQPRFARSPSAGEAPASGDRPAARGHPGEASASPGGGE